jgi:hypothetical protein
VSDLLEELGPAAIGRAAATDETVTRIAEAVLRELRERPVRGEAARLMTLNALALVAAGLIAHDTGLRTYFTAAFDAQLAAKQRRGERPTVFAGGH